MALRRVGDVVIPALGALPCGGLLVENGWRWLAAAGGLGAAGLALTGLARARAQRSVPR